MQVAKESEEFQYDLYSVIVHKGGCYGGYVAKLRPLYTFTVCHCPQNPHFAGGISIPPYRARELVARLCEPCASAGAAVPAPSPPARHVHEGVMSPL